MNYTQIFVLSVLAALLLLDAVCFRRMFQCMNSLKKTDEIAPELWTEEQNMTNFKMTVWFIRSMLCLIVATVLACKFF